MTSQIKPFISRLRRYFKAYGGWPAILKSPLFWLSFCITAINYRAWMGNEWTSTVQSVIPNLLGFSLGTYALLFSLITNRLKRALRAVKNDAGVPYLNEINSTFFHFIFVQVITLLWSFLYQSTLLYDIINVGALRRFDLNAYFIYLNMSGGFFGFLLLIYSIALIIGSALAVYRLALIVDPSADQ